MPRSFTIKGQDDHTWGTFDVIGEQDGKIYGYLKATAAFKGIHPVFLAHEKALALPNSDADVTVDNILKLGAYLVDNASGQRVDINNMIFINENLLVTCELKSQM